MPVYLVENTPDGKNRLVKSKTPSAAIKHVIGDTMTAKALTAEDMVDLLDAGMTIENAMAAEEPVQAAAASEVEAPTGGDDE